jgi:hypothetical protein
MRRVDWLALMRLLLRLLRRCASADLWRSDAPPPPPPPSSSPPPSPLSDDTHAADAARHSEGRAVCVSAMHVLDLCLVCVRGATRTSVFYECLRQRDVLEDWLRYLAAVNALAALPPRLVAAATNVQRLLQAFDWVVPYAQVLRLDPARPPPAPAAGGAVPLALLLAPTADADPPTEDDVRVALARLAPWRQLAGGDRAADAYTPFAEVTDAVFIDGLLRGVLADVRRALRLTE